ncbi:putative RNA-directed DNA polymerase [Helianthus annuus]|nr:putative RNA-directed DNA polymerase [Helianthus annuus]
MKTILRSRDLWDLVETGVDETDKDQTRLKAAVKKDAHAMAIIQQAVHDQLFSRIAGATSAKETWDILRMEFQGDEKVKAVKLQGLRREFENLFMKEDELVGDYFSRVMAIVSQKRSYGETVSDQIIVEKVLRSLSPRFDFIVPTIEVSTDMSTLTPVKLMGALQSQEARLNSRSKERGEKVEEQALQVVQNNRPVFGSTSPRGRGRGSPRGRGRGRIPDRSKVPQCHVCKKFGHLKRDCWYNDDNQAQVVTAEEPAVEPTAQETEEEQPNLFMMFTEEMDEHSSRLWFLDSGCSNHMTGVKESFTNLDESFAVDVNLGDKKKLRVVGKGTVRINMANGSFRLLEDVYYIPRLEYNLLSVGQLMKKGYSIIFNDGKCVITNKRTGVDLLTIKVAKNNMFVLDASRIDHSQFHAHVCKNDEAHLWHLRYGHFHSQGLKSLSEKNMVYGIPSINLVNSCEGCILGKMNQKPYSSHSWRATKPLELIHADLCGAMQVESLGGSLYYFLLIDDFSRMSWVYFLKNKSQAFEKFKAFKTLVEKESEHRIKVLRTDRGGEFCSHEFNLFCENNGIKRELTVSYTPQHNGVVERKNRTIMGMARSMLKETGLPNCFWAEGVATAVYLLNRATTKAVPEKTPYEAWSGRKPSVRHLKVFGCVAFGHVPIHQRRKLDNRAEKCIFIGYAQECKGYRLYNPVTKKLQVKRNVVFFEQNRWEWLDDKTSAGLDNSALQDPFPLMIESDISSNGDHLPSVHASTPNTYENIDMSQNLSSPSSHQSNSPFPQSTPTYDTTHSPDNSTSPSLNTYSNPMSTTNVTSPNVSQELENAASPPQNSDDGPSRRQRKPPSWLHDFESGEGLSDEEAQFLTLTSTDPSTFQEAADKQEWQKAMMSELEAIKKHDTWELVTLPKGKNVVGLKWIFKTKLGVDGKIVKHKARLVVKGYSQLHGIDYQETFAPVARFETIRVVISVAAQRGWELHQLDVKTAFLNGELSEEIYVNQPEGFVKKGDEDKVYRLKKALYGLKQAPRAWYSRIDGYFSQHGYVRSINEPNLYVKKVNNDFIYVCLYVDDIVYTSSSAKLIKEFKACMEQEFEMSDMGLLKLFLGLEVNQTPKGVFLSQKKYAKSLVSKFGMDGCKAEVTPMNANEKLFLDDKADKVDEVMFRSLVGGLIYLTHTRPDLAYSVSLISRFMQSPSKLHLGAAKRILRYVASTIGFGIWYERGVPVQLLGYTDSDWASSIDDRKSVSASVFNLGSGAVTWSSKKQNTVALSSTEAEYVASSAATSQAVWLRRILCDLGLVQESPTVIFCDNHSAINLSRNPVLHGRTKHIEIKHHYVRDMVAQQEISLEYCGTEMQVADVLTKALGREKFIRFRMLLGVEYFEARGDDGNAPKMTVESG